MRANTQQALVDEENVHQAADQQEPEAPFVIFVQDGGSYGRASGYPYWSAFVDGKRQTLSTASSAADLFQQLVLAGFRVKSAVKIVPQAELRALGCPELGLPPATPPCAGGARK